jgi:hypothetical protein
MQRRLRNRVRTRDVPVRVARRESVVYSLALRVGAYGAQSSHAKTLPGWRAGRTRGPGAPAPEERGSSGPGWWYGDDLTAKWVHSRPTHLAWRSGPGSVMLAALSPGCHPKPGGRGDAARAVRAVALKPCLQGPVGVLRARGRCAGASRARGASAGRAGLTRLRSMRIASCRFSRN